MDDLSSLEGNYAVFQQPSLDVRAFLQANLCQSCVIVDNWTPLTFNNIEGSPPHVYCSLLIEECFSEVRARLHVTKIVRYF